MITWRFVSKKYSNKRYYALYDVSLHINSGDFVILKGPSGSGKTTFFKLMICEENITKGEIFFHNEKLSSFNHRQICKLRRKIGMVFQDYKLLQNKTVYENLEFVLDILQFNKKRKKNQILDALNLTKMQKKAHLYPNELSGGEQQRVAIARAFAIRPELILADEATGNLDEENTMGIVKILHAINTLGTTVVFSTHDEKVLSVLRDKRTISLYNGRVAS